MSTRPLVALTTALLLLATACGQAEEPAINVAASPATTSSTTVAPATTTTGAPTTTAAVAPVVFAEPQFDVERTTDVVYGQGIARDSWDAAEGEVVELTLDVYEPVRADDVVAPAVVMIHGGGFTGGSSEHAAMAGMAEQFASRGFVAFSINYRLAGDHGLLPDGYPQVDQQQDQANALYPACRDAKAAVRFVHAESDTYGIDPDAITAVGGSAGSYLAIALGTTDESACVDEISVDDDPTLASTNLDQSSAVDTVIDHWGGDSILVMLSMLGAEPQFDSTDAPISIVHGTADPTVTIDHAERLVAAYESTGVPYEYHPLEGAGHGVWGAAIDGQTLFESAFDFVVEQQTHTVG